MKISSKAFTLIELLVVIAIIGVLSSVVLVSLNSARGDARDVTRSAQAKELKKALEVYYLEHGSYPVTTCTPIQSVTELAPYINIDGLQDPYFNTQFRYRGTGGGYAFRIHYEDTDMPGTSSSGVCLTGVNFSGNVCSWGLQDDICEGV